jgi:hypothetical protein
MTWNQHFGLERDQIVQRCDPGAAVGVADIWHPAAKHQVAGIEDTVFLHQHRHVLGGMRRADVAQREMEAAHFEVGVAFQEAVRFDQLRVVVHPREKRFLALGQTQGRILGAGCAFGGAVHPDFGALRLENLQAVEMVGVVMADDDQLDGLLGDLADQAEHFFGQRRGSEGIEDDHAVARDDKPGIGHEALVLGGCRTGQALNEVTVGAHPHRLHRHGDLGGVGGFGCLDSRQQAEQGEDEQ